MSEPVLGEIAVSFSTIALKKTPDPAGARPSRSSWTKTGPGDTRAGDVMTSEVAEVPETGTVAVPKVQFIREGTKLLPKMVTEVPPPTAPKDGSREEIAQSGA